MCVWGAEKEEEDGKEVINFTTIKIMTEYTQNLETWRWMPEERAK